MARIIKQRILAKLGRSIVGPVLPKLAANGASENLGLEEKRTNITCISCGCEISLDEKVFYYYGGPAKCFSCGARLRRKMDSGILQNNGLIKPFFDSLIEHNSQRSVIGQGNKRA